MTATVFIRLDLSIARARARNGMELTEYDLDLLQKYEGEPTVDWRHEMQCLPAGSVVLAFLVLRDDGEIVEVAEPCYFEGGEEEEYERALREAREFLAAA